MNEITTNRLKHLLDKNPDINLIDVRTPIEFAAAHIDGASNYPLEDLHNFNLPKESKYYLSCRSGNRSEQAYNLLQKMGYSNLVNVKGGILAWEGETISTL